MSVTLSEVSSATDGPSKRCVVEMRAGKAGTVVMSSTALTWQEAIKLALRQASERLTALCRAGPAAQAQRRPLMARPPLLR